jgi:hypothetical protein
MKSREFDDNFQRNLYLVDFLFDEINVYFKSDMYNITKSEFILTIQFLF